LIAQAEGTGITRREVLDAIYPAFARDGASKDEIVAAAVTAEPRSEIVELLGRLPARRYPSVREVWSDLPEMPIS
jgi:hypothetical protein